MVIGQIFYQEMGLHVYKCRVVALLDKERCPQVVYRYYGKHKQWWHYKVESLSYIKGAFDIGLYKLKNKGWG